MKGAAQAGPGPVRSQPGRQRVLGLGLEVLDLVPALGPTPGAPTLVFLHEGLGAVSFWRDFPARLVAATGCPALVYSRPGYGTSAPATQPRGPDYLEREGETVLPALLAARHIRQPLLIGHSDGASIALIYGSAFPDRLVGAAVLAPHLWVEEAALAGIRQAGRLWRETDWPARLARHHGDPERVFREWHDTWLSPAFRGWDIRGRLGTFRAPLLAIQGEGDEYATPEQVRALPRLVSGPVRVAEIPRCGHTPFRDQPEQVLALLTDFVNSRKGAEGAG